MTDPSVERSNSPLNLPARPAPARSTIGEKVLRMGRGCEGSALLDGSGEPMRLIWPRPTAALVMLILTLGGCHTATVKPAQDASDIPVAATMTTESAGRSGEIAARSVFRVVCRESQTGGTGFLHKSGRVVTAEHVVTGCSDITVIPATGSPVNVAKVQADPDLDLALLELAKPIAAPTLPLSTSSTFTVGLAVSTWGFPGGYSARIPLLSVGYLAGRESVNVKGKGTIHRTVVNAAFNLGNSGGPLINIETGEVIGVVSSKLAPVPPFVESAIHALDQLEFGVMFTFTAPDGSEKQMSQGRLLAEVLRHLRSQVQLVVGKAVEIDELRSFLVAQGIEP